jgi:hypothetical protein
VRVADPPVHRERSGCSILFARSDIIRDFDELTWLGDPALDDITL